MKKRSLLIIAVFILLFCACKKDKTVGFIAEKAMVVSAREEASKIGAAILQKGGNAYDAMIATHLALAVVYPVAGNIGGGGFMVYRNNDGTTGALDFREKAPITAHRDMYLDSVGNVIKNKSTLGAFAVGVPGSIAGVFEVYNKFGSLPFKDLIQPAIDLAKNGITVTEKQAKSLNSATERFKKVNNYITVFEKEWKKGDILKQEELAQTLERIRDLGKDGFYKGKTASLFVNYVKELGGIISLEDLEKYKAIWRKPITFNYKDFKITSMTLPASGGICLAQILKAVEPYDLSKIEHNSTKYIQLLTEAERRSYADRANFLGDIDFVNVPVDSLINAKYINNRMKSFSWDKATPSSEVSHGKILGYESDETTHYSIVDQFGNAVSVTTTLNTGYGSKVVVKGAGFILNNEMDDFSSKPGVPNVYGLLGSEANSIAPEKRMLSSMTPTIVEENGKLKMVVGTPGGSTIITSVLQNILNVTEYKMGMQESVDQPRFHHQWLPDVVRMEPNGFNEETKAKLETLGYKILERNSLIIGRVDAILVLPNGKLEAGADKRGDDAAAGF
ncbi:gamma-glutamyltransferase [Polaribacter sp. KT 15]|uniref:gamma-glutamyltransferase n=1 Tax=Polaribacter sp. KT 15 TaxID=1896175 RepID=UPI00090A4371|nr:gamma-glutamyltransferase [Polaribacter sp. KT 15]SHN03885.1 gamma-glutamyltranspeptidase / glutathione hydrolase [Polaribacter sp. KT 15]